VNHTVAATAKRIVTRSAKRLLYSAGGRSKQRWSIGIYAGPSPYRLGPTDDVQNPVLDYAAVSDVAGLFVADPFMLDVDATWYMFFEVLNGRTGKGEIGLATSRDVTAWTYRGIVLAEPFHLSYPYVFHWRGDYYMVPESHQAASIRLYRAARFPTDWRLVCHLMAGHSFSDSSIFRFDDRWWLFSETNPDFRHDTLRLYSAEVLTGAWIEHPRSPIVAGNARQARPAGRVVALPDRVIRYAQDCYPVYGAQVRAFEVTELSPTVYGEHEVAASPVLGPSGSGWNRSRMHHVDPHETRDGHWVACVDGWGAAP
jgi:hypothetical protein